MRNVSGGTLTYKRLGSALVVLMLLLAVALPAMASGAATGTIVNPAGGNVNLRRWASLDAPVICSMAVGTKVQIVRAEGDWYCVNVGNVCGYVYGSFVSIDWPAPSEKYATVSVGPLSVYDAPQTTAYILTTLQSGAQVVLLQPGDTWTQIRVGNVVGYVFTSYLIFDGKAPAPAPKPPVVRQPAPKPPVTQNANAAVRTKNGGNLNLRNDASANAAVITSYPNGTRVRVITHGSTWCKVQVGDLVGYMVTSYLAFDGMTIPPIKTAPKGAEGIVRSSLALNLRKSPSTSSAILGQYKSGTRVSILGVGTEWLRVRVDGKVGYMMAKYVQLSDALTPHKTVINPGTFVNLRQGAGFDQKVLKQVPHGAAATVVIPYPDWSRVIVKDGAGYLSGFMVNQFLK